MAAYREHCAACHGVAGAGDGPETSRPLADLRSPPASRRHAGELFWLVSHGIRAGGMPAFGSRLSERQRWDVINFIRALGAADASKTIGRQVEPDRAWLIAPDCTIAVGPLAPGALRDYRGRRMVLLVLYTLPGSRARMTELARSYDMLSIIGVEVIAVPTHASPEAISELGSSPPVLFPVVTDGNADIVATYRMFAPGVHAELLIDRQGCAAGARTGEQQWEGRGVVRAVYPQLLVITHEEIRGLIPARTTGFRAAAPTIRDSIRVGDAIRFSLRGTVVDDVALVAIERW